MSIFNKISRIHSRRLTAKKRATARWEKDRQRRNALAAIDPVRLGGIIRRIIVIDRETTTREIVFYEHDRYVDRRRKLRVVRDLALT